MVPAVQHLVQTATWITYALAAAGACATVFLFSTLVVNAIKELHALRCAEREARADDDAYVDHCIATASDPSVNPWPPVRLVKGAR